MFCDPFELGGVVGAAELGAVEVGALATAGVEELPVTPPHAVAAIIKHMPKERTRVLCKRGFFISS